MPDNKHPDFILLGITAVLILLGILILASISTSLSLERFGKTSYYLNHQILFGILPGIILAFLVFKISLNFLKKWGLVLLLINLVLLGMVFLPRIGLSLGGAVRWIAIGPILFQPSEILKITFILYLASWLAARTSLRKSNFSQKTKREWSQTLIAFLIVMGILSIFLIFQPDISTLGIILAISIIIYFLAQTPLWHSLLIILIVILGLLAVIKIAPYRANRLLVFLQPETDPMGLGYQMKQALITVGSGGISGLGLGMSRQKFGFLPQTMSDSIFAIFAEETGFIGSLILVFLFLIFFWRGFKIAQSVTDKFSQLLALAITFWIILQAFVNIGSMIGILPLSGVPLPFISYGGSHLVAELVGVGILLNISKNTS